MTNFLGKLLNGQKVEWKKLGEVTYWDKRFNGVDKDMQPTVLKYNHVSAEFLKSLKIEGGDIKLLSTGNFDGYTVDLDVGDSINEGEVITIPTGGTANIKYYKGKFIDSGNLLGTGREGVNTKYIYHFLLNSNELIQSYFRGSGVKHPDMKQILEIPLPLPPLSVQKEIVEILDTLTNHTAELTAELAKELTARKKQYNHYREKLLTFGEGVEWKKLGEVCEFVRGLTYSRADESANQDGYKVLRANNITLSGNIINFNDIKYVNLNTKVKDNQKLYKNDILISVASGSREHVGKVAFIYDDIDYYFGGFMGVVRCSKEVMPRFVFHILTGSIFQEYLNEMLNSSTINNINSSMMNALPIPLPPLAVQKEIVEILDKFDTLTNSTTDGLQKEIDLRQKQYEYYRNQLLNFDK